MFAKEFFFANLNGTQIKHYENFLITRNFIF